MNQQLRADADRIVRESIAAVLPDAAVRRALAEFCRPAGRLVLVAVGKADKDKAMWILTWDDIMGQLWPQITEQLDQVAPGPQV